MKHCFFYCLTATNVQRYFIKRIGFHRLQLETENGEYDSIIHVGDFAYDMDSVNILQINFHSITYDHFPNYEKLVVIISTLSSSTIPYLGQCIEFHDRLCMNLLALSLFVHNNLVNFYQYMQRSCKKAFVFCSR